MPRQDIFSFIHKGLRSMIYDQGKKLMQTDFADQDAVWKELNNLEHSLNLLEDHGKHEERHVFPAIKEQASDMVDDFTGQHRNIDRRISAVQNSLSRIKGIKNVEERIQEGEKLNRIYNDLAAYYLEHMNREETEMLPATWQFLSDEEIGNLRSNIQKEVTPERLAEQLTWSIGATNNTELIGLLKGLKATAPETVIENMKRIAEKALPKDRWDYIRSAAGV